MKSYKIRKRRPGTTLVEAIISMIVVFIAIAAILVTVAQSAQMIAKSREDLGIYTFAANWMELLETQPPNILVNNFETAVENVANMMDPEQTGSGTTRFVNGYEVRSTRGTYANGVVNITVTFFSQIGSGRQGVTATKQFNTITNSAVSNDVVPVFLRGNV